MGSKHSAAVEQPRQKMAERPAALKGPPPIYSSAFEINPNELMKFDLNSLIHGASIIPRPKTMHPISCLTETSIPIILAPVRYLNDEKFEYQLPVLALSRADLGRVVCFGNLEILALCEEPESEDYVIFIENLLRWVGGPHPQARLALVSNNLGDITQPMLFNLRGLGYGFEMMTDEMTIDFSKYAFFIVESDFDFPEGMTDFLIHGGGLIVGAAPQGKNNRFKVNSVISHIGIGFPNGQFSNVQSEEKTFNTSYPFVDLQNMTLPVLIRTVLKKLNEYTNNDPAEIDMLVTTIRYHIELLNRGQCEFLTPLCDATISYLHNTDFEQEGKICAHPTQAMVALIITESFLKMDAHELCQFDVGHIFPGISQQFLDEKTIHVSLRNCKWHSFGLWLPPGVVTFISFPKYAENILIQVGSHPEFIAEKPGPWKRWPSVVLTFEVTRPQIELSTPYGGMVYFLTKKPPTKKSIKFTASFTDICLCPFYNVKKPKKWEKTKDNLIPWAEIITKYAAFTIPSDVARRTPSLDEFVGFIDEMITFVDKFLSIAIEELQYRIVFDVELPQEGFICGYPIVMDLDAAPSIFGGTKPTKELFSLLTLIGITGLPENVFSLNFEASIASTAAAFAFQQKWSTVNPTDFSGNSPRLFLELWSLYTKKGPSGFQTASASILDPKTTQGKSTDMTEKAYIDLLGSIIKEDLSYLAEFMNPDTNSHFSFVLSSVSDDLTH